MNITTFRELILQLNLNEAEKRRINNLGGKYFKFLCKFYNLNPEENLKLTWYKLNQELEKEEKRHKQEVHFMRNSKFLFQDYSHLDYNNVTDDF